MKAPVQTEPTQVAGSANRWISSRNFSFRIEEGTPSPPPPGTNSTSRRGASLKDCFDKANDIMRPKYGNWPIFEHCLPFNVSRAYDEARGIAHPRIWTDKRDLEMWEALQG